MGQKSTNCLKTTVKCGNWIYPYSSSRSSVQYSIKAPTILNKKLIRKEQ
jgi:hypothetical protein